MTKPSLFFFGNEKLATGIEVEPVIRRSLEAAGYQIEAQITGPIQNLPENNPKLAVLAAYGRILPQSVLDRFELGIINIHPSLLPVYRGPTPIEQAILDGVSKTGVSIMKLTAAMDEGPLFKQQSIQLTGHESKSELAASLQQLGADLMIQVLPRILDGSLKPRRQPHPDRDASYSKKITKADGIIDWTKPAEQIEREVRAYLGWPGSQTELNGQDVQITAVRVLPGKGHPGRTFKIGPDLAVYCGQNVLVIQKLKPAGKPEMSGQAYLAGHPLKG